MQSLQVSDAQLIQVLIDEFLPKLYGLAYAITEDSEESRQIAERIIYAAAANRRRFWGSTSLRSWVYEMAFHHFQNTGKLAGILARLPFLASRARRWPAVSAVRVEKLTGELTGEHHRLGEALQEISGRDLTLLYLRYVHGLKAGELAYTLKSGERNVLERLRVLRIAMWTRSSSSPPPSEEYCQSYHHQMHANLDGSLDENGQEELKQHMLSCAACRAYLAYLVENDLKLGSGLQAGWVAPEMPALNVEAVTSGVGENVVKTRRQRRVSRLAKEMAVVAAAIVAVIALSSMGQLAAGDPYPTPAAANPMIAAEATQPEVVQSLPRPTRDPSRRRRFRSFSPGTANNYPPGFGATPGDSAYLPFKPLQEHGSPAMEVPEINLSGSVNLRLLLNYWGEKGNPIPYLQPNHRDETVMFNEMVNYVEDHTNLKAMLRMGGELETIKDFIKAGIPVMVQKGYENPGADGWAGHYVVVNGFDDPVQQVILLAAYPEDGGDTPMDYAEFIENWRSFNYTYLVVYPTEKDRVVRDILGSQVDLARNFQHAAAKAKAEAQSLTSPLGRFFAWFNQGSSLTYLEDYSAAKEAFDQAFTIYQELPTEDRPWRILWYQTRPYWAYFYTGGYQEVIDLATSALNSMDDPLLEESLYWRALAREALGDMEGAIQDLNEAIRLNPNFVAGKYQLRRIKGES